MRFVAIEDSQINLTSMNMTTGEADTSVDLKHSKDGVTWTQYDFNPIPLAAGETLYLKGNNENGFTTANSLTNEGRVCTFFDVKHDGSTAGKFECHGNIMSLLYGDDFENKFNIPNLNCFYELFVFTPITTAPELPATTLTCGCYCEMFAGCEFLTESPILPASKLPDACYNFMFKKCVNLSKITMLATDISGLYCLIEWVDETYTDGTFIKHPDMDSLPTGVDGIPEGWTVIDYDFKN